MQNQIPKNWQKVKLGDFAKDIRDLYEPVKNDHLKYIGLEHIEKHSLNLNSIGDSAATQSTKKRFQENDVLFGTLRSYFRKVVKPKFSGVCSTDIAVLRAKNGFDQNFLYYFIANPYFVKFASNPGDGTRMPRAKWSFLSNTEWFLPPFKDQQKMATILSDFDDKIEVNNKIAKTLEEMAQLIFKEWFVKFKFPGWKKAKFVDSELGKVPEGWKLKSWKELEKETFAGDWGDAQPNEDSTKKVYVLRGTDIPALKTGGMGDCPVRFVSKESFEKRRLKQGDIVIEISGGSKGQPTGRNIYITKKILERFEYPLICTSFCRLVRSNNILDSIFMYLHLDKLYKSKAIWNYQVQSTGISNFQYGYFEKSEIIVVPAMIFQEKIITFMKTCLEFGQSNEDQKLTAMRDLLLLKLMKGEIRV